MQRDIDACGCEFRVDYTWDDRNLVLEGVYIDGNDLTDLLSDSAIEKIEERLYELYGEDMADRAEYFAEMRVER
jgi:hypothetical protein